MFTATEGGRAWNPAIWVHRLRSFLTSGCTKLGKNVQVLRQKLARIFRIQNLRKSNAFSRCYQKYIALIMQSL